MLREIVVYDRRCLTNTSPLFVTSLQKSLFQPRLCIVRQKQISVKEKPKVTMIYVALLRQNVFICEGNTYSNDITCITLFSYAFCI